MRMIAEQTAGSIATVCRIVKRLENDKQKDCVMYCPRYPKFKNWTTMHVVFRLHATDTHHSSITIPHSVP